MAKITPPFAVPSNLVNVIPVNPTASLKSLAWLIAFCPVPASKVSMISCGAVSSYFLNSSMRLFLFCKRPAVSAIKISMLRAAADCIASKITDAESDPVLCATTGILLRSPHTWSCSTAAARKVSPAANMTDFPSFWNLRANLPIVVVLPTPFTPTIKIT